MVRLVDAARDRLGLPVDRGIRDTVAALNLLGLPTLQSCEGHVNLHGHGLAAPWVDFVVDSAVLAGVAALLDAFYAQVERVADDVRLRLEGERLGNGGGFAALETVRRSLVEGRLGADQIDTLRRALRARQAEMQRFTDFLCRHLLERSQAS